MTRARCHHLLRKRGWALVFFLLASLLGTPGPEARRKKDGEKKEGEKADGDKKEGEKGERRKKERDKKRKDKEKKAEEELLAPQPVCDDKEARCESRLGFYLFEDAVKPRPLGKFRYRLRLSDKLIEGACPGQDPLARCVEGGLLVQITPEQLDVAFEVDGYRPLLQAVTPAYQLSRSGCATPCKQADLRLMLRRETEEPEEQ